MWHDIWPSMVTNTRNLCSAFNPSTVHTHSSEYTHTHTVNTVNTHTQLTVNTHTHTDTHTHTEQWAAIYAVAPGEQLGVRCLAQGWRVERTLYIHSPPPPQQFLSARDSSPQPLNYESYSLTLGHDFPPIYVGFQFHCHYQMGLLDFTWLSFFSLQ